MNVIITRGLQKVNNVHRRSLAT